MRGKGTVGPAVVALAAVLSLAPASAARGDTVKLKNGNRIDGTVLQETDEAVTLRMPTGGSLTVPRRSIAQILRAETPAGPPGGAAGRPGAPPSPPAGPRAGTGAGRRDPFVLPEAGGNPGGAEAMPAAVKDLLENLGSPDAKERQDAANALGNQAYEALKWSSRVGAWSKPAVEALADALDDPDPSVRYNAAYSIGMFGPEGASAVDDLIALLKSDDKRGHAGALYGLGGIGPAAEPALPLVIDALQDDSLKHSAARAAGGIGPAAEEAIPLLLKHLKAYLATRTDNMTGGGEFAEALGGIGPAAAEAVPLLAKLRLDRDSNLRRGALKGLAGIGDDGLDPLLSTLDYKGPALGRSNTDDPSHIRWDAAEACWKMAGPQLREAIPGLLARILDDEEDVFVQGYAGGALCKLGKEAAPAMKKARAHLYARSRKEGLSVERTRILRDLNTTLAALGVGDLDKVEE